MVMLICLYESATVLVLRDKTDGIKRQLVEVNTIHYFVTQAIKKNAEDQS